MCSGRPPLPTVVAPHLKAEREKLEQRIAELKDKTKRLPAVNPKGHKATVTPVETKTTTTAPIKASTHDSGDSLMSDIVTIGVAAAVMDSMMDDSSHACCGEHGCSFGGSDSYDSFSSSNYDSYDSGGWSSSSGGGWD